MTRLWAFLWTITRFMFHVLVIVAHLSGERVRGCPPFPHTHRGPPTIHALLCVGSRVFPVFLVRLLVSV